MTCAISSVSPFSVAMPLAIIFTAIQQYSPLQSPQAVTDLNPHLIDHCYDITLFMDFHKFRLLGFNEFFVAAFTTGENVAP